MIPGFAIQKCTHRTLMEPNGGIRKNICVQLTTTLSFLKTHLNDKLFSEDLRNVRLLIV